MRRVYIVDDNKHVRDSLATLLTLYGYRVSEYQSGEAFVRDLADLQSGIALIDLNMHAVSGREVLREIHQSDRKIVAIIISAIAKSEATELRAMGVHDIFQKPFDEGELLKCIEAKFQNQPLRDRGGEDTDEAS